MKKFKYVSTERIYKFIWNDKKKVGHLTINSFFSKTKRSFSKSGFLEQSKRCYYDRVCIENRPLVVAKKQRIGDIEINLVIGENHKGVI